MRRTAAAACVLTALVLSCAVASAQSAGAVPRRLREPWTRAVGNDTTRLAYRGLDYGSEAYFSPLTVLLNKGFDIYQVRDSPRDFWAYPYGAAWDHAIKGVFDGAAPAIARFGGWSRFTRFELLPISWSEHDANWVPNYLEHLLGGGITMRMLDEWYRDHHVPLPRLWAMLTTYGASVLNEITEARGDTIARSPAVADLLFFDVAAVTLFHWDQPTRFFTQTLQLADWSNQATFTFPDRKLQNNGEYMTLKVPIGLERARIFIRFGLSGQTGFSWKLDEEHHVSFGLGGDTQARFVDKTGHETVAFARGGGVYYDRNNSLLWSAVAGGNENIGAVNVYPGVLPGIARNLGAWVVYTRHGQVAFGVVHRRALGLGLGLGR
jgi:hypothetical protein